MSQVFIFLLGAVLGGAVVLFCWLALDSRFRGNDKLRGGKQKEMTELVKEQAKDKEENRRKILELLDSNQKITNDQIQRLLNVSDATVVRYLDELEKEGVLRQVGITGQSVHYEKIT